MQLLRGRQGSCALDVIPQRGKSYVELVVVADDVPGLLAKITGVLFANKLDIMDAAIYSREPFGDADHRRGAGHLPGAAGRPRGATIDDARIESIRRDLLAVLEGRVAVESLVDLAGGVDARRSSPGPSPRCRPPR